MMLEALRQILGIQPALNNESLELAGIGSAFIPRPAQILMQITQPM